MTIVGFSGRKASGTSTAVNSVPNPTMIFWPHYCRDCQFIWHSPSMEEPCVRCGSVNVKGADCLTSTKEVEA